MKHLLLPAVLALAACATIQPQQQVDPKIVAEFSKRGVPELTTAKVRSGMPLNVDDVAASAKAGVPGPGMVSYMQSTRKAYNLSNADIARLRKAGTPSPVINYMQRSYDLYTKGPNAVDQRHPYFNPIPNNSPIRAPFAYAPPQVDTFFNSAYEESLYSPFSDQ